MGFVRQLLPPRGLLASLIERAQAVGGGRAQHARTETPCNVPGPARSWDGWLGAVFVALSSAVYGGSLILARFAFQASTDSNYHFAVAREIAQGHFRSEVQHHLPWTILEQLPVDHYFGYHVLLAPFAALPDPVWGMKLATFTLFMAVPLSVYAFLRAQAVRGAWAWALLPLLFAKEDWRYLMLRGGHWIAVLSILFLHVAFFVRRERLRWLGIVLIGYVATLSYQGGLVLLPLHLSALASTWLLRRDALDRRRLLEPLLTALGLALGFTLNPYMNAQAATWRFAWHHIVFMSSDPAGLYSSIREFGPPPLRYLPYNPQYILATLTILAAAGWVVSRSLRKQQPSRLVAVLLGPAVAGVIMTARALRMEEYAVPWATLFLASASSAARWPLPRLRRMVEPVTAVLLCLLLFIKWPDTFNLLGRHLPTAQYRGARALLDAYRGPPVLNISEADYTTLRWEDPNVVAVQGLSHYFLYPNRPVFDDVMLIRESPDRGAQLKALLRFYDRGVRLVAVQQRHRAAVLLAAFPEAFDPRFASRLSPAAVPLGAVIFVMNRVGLLAAIERAAAEDAHKPSTAEVTPAAVDHAE